MDISTGNGDVAFCPEMQMDARRTTAQSHIKRMF